MKLKEQVIEKYAKRFRGFKKRRWYLEWVLELQNFLKEIDKAH